MTIRLHCPVSLELNSSINLDKQQSHYLANVMRAKQSDIINIFNAEFGEFEAEITTLSKNYASVLLKKQLRLPLIKEKKLTLAFAPIKNPNSSYLVQKATELGVTEILPIITERTIVRNLSSEKLSLVAIEAAEQCERLSIPTISEPIKLTKIPTLAKNFTNIFFCYERAHSENSLLSILINHKNELDNSLVITGPEGGFSESEISIIQSLDNVKSVSLGDKILRADTAIISALATFNAVLNL